MIHPATNLELSAARVCLSGNVQGIGYRPVLARLAQACGLCGWVRNTAAGIEIHIEGMDEAIARFLEDCQRVCPANGSVSGNQTQRVEPEWATEFRILATVSSEPTATAVPRDVAVCSDCLAEVADPTDHRHGYLLTSCSSCGPRYSIIHRMPYERESTAMVKFPPCTDCSDEYQSHADRRFHTQSIACPDCGPSLTDIYSALECLRAGKILAIKGVGGYQLLVDAFNPVAIQRLRECKQRMSKPLAVMVADGQRAGDIAQSVSEIERTLLAGPVGPIVVMQVRSGALPASLAPHLSTIGMMLPTTPLHAWMVRTFGPLVVTSGNIEGQPLVYEPDEAKSHLAAVADRLVDHNRPIVRPIDDSVVRVIAGRAATLRLARGLAPLPISVSSASAAGSEPLPHILALGGHQKVAIALSNSRQAILGQHIGDLDTLETRERFIRHIADMVELYRAAPEVIVHDAHDDYFTSQWAKEYCRENGVRRLAVQHHHAHIAAGMVEQGWLDQTVLGVAWDGTGLGNDGTLWGGEFLLTTTTEFERVACLRPLALPGGEAAIREPWRIAAAMLHELRAWDRSIAHHIEGQSRIASIADNRRLSPLSTSIGRLFDAVAALVLPDPALRMGYTGYEGHFAAMLEDLCNVEAQGAYPFPVLTADPRPGTSEIEASSRLVVLDWRPLVRAILCDLESGVARENIAMRFHRSLAAGIQQVARLYDALPVVLGGGVFQNKILVELVQQELGDRTVALPGVIPVGDGGLAAGQLAIACPLLERERCA